VQYKIRAVKVCSQQTVFNRSIRCATESC